MQNLHFHCFLFESHPLRSHVTRTACTHTHTHTHTIGHSYQDPASILAALKRDTKPKTAEVTPTAPLNTHSVSISSDEFDLSVMLV